MSGKSEYSVSAGPQVGSPCEPDEFRSPDFCWDADGCMVRTCRVNKDSLTRIFAEEGQVIVAAAQPPSLGFGSGTYVAEPP